MPHKSDATDPPPGAAASIISAQTMAAFGRVAESMAKFQQSPGMKQLAESVAKAQSSQMRQIAESLAKFQQSPGMEQLAESVAKTQSSQMRQIAESMAKFQQSPGMKQLAESVAKTQSTQMKQIAESMAKLHQSPAMAQLANAVLAQQSAQLAQPRRAVELQRSAVFGLLIDGVLKSHTRPEARVPAYEEAARQFLFELGAVGDEDDDPIPFAPSSDDTAYEVLAQAAPDVAAAIDEAAQRARLPFWSRRAVRNGLAWLLATLIVAAYVGGTVLFPPWGPIFVALLSGGGVTAPGVYKRISGSAEESSLTPPD